MREAEPPGLLLVDRTVRWEPSGPQKIYHFDRPIYRFTPFVNAGIGNGILDTRLLSQPFRLTQLFKTLGFIADLEGGADFTVMRGVKV